MKFVRKVFATIISFIVDVIGGSFFSYLADITFLNKIFTKKIKKLIRRTKFTMTIWLSIFGMWFCMDMHS